MQPYYQDSGITIYHGEALETMVLLPGASIDAVITDPPYGTTACSWDTVIPFALMWEALRRLVKPRAPVVLFGSQPFTSALVMSNPKDFRYSWIWEKDVGTGFLDAPDKPLKVHEDIAVFYQQQPTYNPQKTKGARTHSIKTTGYQSSDSLHNGKYKVTPSDETSMKYPRSVLQFRRIPPPKRNHPTEKPIELLSYLIATYTNPDDTVLDFTVGSGTTLRAAKNLGRKAIGIELEERYCDIAARRLSQEVMAFEEVG